MRQVIRDTFFDFTAKREGFTPFMYCDTLNLVTTGVGNLIDRGPRNGFDISAGAMAPAMSLPWRHKAAGWTSSNPIAGELASPEEIRESWIRTKLKEQEVPGFNKKGGFAYANFQPLTLDLASLKALFTKTLNSFDATLASRYPTYQQAPADAQLAMLSMAWALGPAFDFPAFKAAFDAGDYRKAGDLSYFKGGGGTPTARTGRNADNVIMFNNAADVVKGGVDHDRLFFPGSVTTSPGVFPSGAGIANISGKPTNVPLTVGAVGAVAFGVFKLGRWKGWF
jgi:hypothetical protein